MKYPHYEIYEKLYERYFKRSVYDLINLADIKQNDKVIDLCGGNARLTKELKKLTNDVTYVDQEKDMIPDILPDLGIKVINKSMEKFLQENKNKYEKVFCQQAINYWLLNINPQHLSNLVNKGGYLIFNTFNTKTSTKPLIKEYTIDDNSFLEISYLVDNKIEHVQIREGFPPHFTEFDYISEEKFNEILSPYFNIEIIKDGKTSIYKCQKK